MGDHRENKAKDPREEIVCLCNEVKRGTIEDAIKSGCNTLNKVYDRTSAGVGPCGGSCPKFFGPMLDHYLATGQFPTSPIRPKAQKKNRGR